MQRIAERLELFKNSVKKPWIKTGVQFKVLPPVRDSRDKEYYVEIKHVSPKIFLNIDGEFWENSYLIIEEKWGIGMMKQSKKTTNILDYKYQLSLPKVRCTYTVGGADTLIDKELTIRYECHGDMPDHFPQHHLHGAVDDPRYEVHKHMEIDDFINWIGKEFVGKRCVFNHTKIAFAT